eukprot:TRINITY_DN37073_c0_g2_i1.p1 TRINITY_DN37073_c0_g2~~TRINITY_DN37073_c0_g2_i1.p1  ORF type:complete len:234 (-),score=34.06 TRINITY_DN37073_c0_g2_i1:133-834(-)
MSASCVNCLRLRPGQWRSEDFPGLPGDFVTWLKMRPMFMDELFAWQETHRHLFRGPTEEFPLEATVAYDTLMANVDLQLETFLNEQGATIDDMSNALHAMQESDDPRMNLVFRLILRSIDFPSLSMMVRKNTCLCCSGVFKGLIEPQDTQETPEAQAVGPVAPAIESVWVAHTDPNTGSTYYHNLADGTTTWDPPPQGAEAPVTAGYNSNQDLANPGDPPDTGGYKGDTGGCG